VRGVEEGWLYVVGDVNHRAQGKYQAQIPGQAIIDQAAGRPLNTSPWGPHVTSADSSAVPQDIFTTPEAAAVGRTAEQAAAEDSGSGWSTSISVKP
jgi:dihydrolipoamide dehydrogenase